MSASIVRGFCGQEHTVFIHRRWSFLSAKKAFEVIGHPQFEEDTSYKVNNDSGGRKWRSRSVKHQTFLRAWRDKLSRFSVL